MINNVKYNASFTLSVAD